MLFNVAPNVPGETGPKDNAYLVTDRWDDWGKYRTQFYLCVYDSDGTRHDIGHVKIGRQGLRPANQISPGFRAPELSTTFPALDSMFFSLGQNETYYQSLAELGPDAASAILIALRDCAFDLNIFNANRGEDVMSESLLRSVDASNVAGRLHRLANGNAKLTSYHFEYTGPAVEGVNAPTLEFRVIPNTNPPTNVHALIGRNGAGKTRLIRGLAQSILTPSESKGTLKLHTTGEPWSFASVVFVSFSAFDIVDLPAPENIALKAALVSLRGQGAVSDDHGKTSKAGASLFANSLRECKRGLLRRRWLDAIATLESDPLFAEANVTALADLPDDEWEDKAMALFELLSSGHAVVLLTITRLVELVDEFTLVLLDEPEGHLHPPLLSALVRSLSNLLTSRNGVAIVATHSPVVLQEMPRSCVWKLDRSNLLAKAERPAIETFGESVGVLTSEIFGLEVTASGFHKLVADAVADSGANYDAAIGQFGGQLGSEARAIARGLSAQAKSDKTE